jgi:hypothetical protein
MLSPLRNRFGIPGVISVIALVFAMFGGAYAASGALTAKQKKEVKKIAKGFQGTGPAGAQGPAGPQGAKGDTGVAGANGKDGTNGVSATTTSFAGAKAPCTEGGVEVKSASPTALVCNGVKGADGEDGEPWTAGGTLPPGETEAGAWATSSPGFYPISFGIPLAAPLDENHVHKSEDPGFATNCPGTLADPEAAPGHLCVYARLVEAGQTTPFLIFDPSTEVEDGAAATGAGLLMVGEGFGTWAVTAPLVP